MPWWCGRTLVVCLGCAMPLAFAACAGKSSNQPGGETGQGGSSGTAGTSSTGGSRAGGCTYNGVHHERGETFGECNECACDAESGVVCKAIACVPGTGGIGSSAGGASGTAGTNNGSPGCDSEGKHFDEGASWPVDCNTCYCKGARAVCTQNTCPSGLGGSAGSGTGGGVAGAGAAGEGGGSTLCTYAPIGSFCVVGSPSGDGQDLAPGMRLAVSMRPAGCYSSSCTKLVSSDCNYIGSDGAYWVSGFLCLVTEGGACTADCGGGGNPVCEPGVTLAAGDYAVAIAGTSLAVKFSVPSHVAGDGLCASLSDP